MTKTTKQAFLLARKSVLYLTMAVFLFAVYAILPLKGNGLSAFADSVFGLNRGAMINFVFARTPQTVPELTFKHGSGQPVTISQWRGKVVLLNLWATWCGPCREEMPDLNRLQIELGGPDFEVVAVSTDWKGAEASKSFLDEVGAKSLALYIDKSGKISRDLNTRGLPLTVLIDRDGLIVGRLKGPAHWASPEAKALIRSVIAKRNQP